MENTKLSSQNHTALLTTLKQRFKQNMNRHKDFDWSKIQAKLEVNPKKLAALHKMENTGGEPDVVGYDKKTGEYIFFDCAPESPNGRRSICYDRSALDARKANKPENDAMSMAKDMGVSILTEAQYRELQQFGKFDRKTSSWIETPSEVRKLGGALFCDCRYETIFTYHNGADSYYAARGFRAALKV